MAYLDTSLLVAYYCPEPLSSKVDRLLRQATDHAISPLVEVELYSAVAAKTRAGGLNAADARRIFAEFQRHLAESRFTILPVSGDTYAAAGEWIASLKAPLRVLDALHLATAHAHGQVLWTADRQLAAAARQLAVPCKLVTSR